MDIKPLEVLYALSPGYRVPPARGRIAVFHALKRYEFNADEADRLGRIAWGDAVARLILGPGGKYADLVRTDPIPPPLPGRELPAVPRARHYRIGELKRPGSPIHFARRPGDPPAHAAGGLVLVDHLPPGDPRRGVAGWGRRAGCFLVVDADSGDAYLYRRPDDCSARAIRTAVERAFGFNGGPWPSFPPGARWPAVLVRARQWDERERGVLAGQRRRKGARRSDKTARAIEARRERWAAERAARAAIATAARAVEAAYRRERTAAAWVAVDPGGRRARGLARASADLVTAWEAYRQAVEAGRPAIVTGRPVKVPRCVPGSKLLENANIE